MKGTPVRALVGQLVDGRYLVESHIADGGMGSVYVALDTRLDRPVALKVMREDLARNDRFVERFRREARSAARVSHPNVVAVYDQGEHDGLVWLAMELVGNGRTLRTWLHEAGALTPREALRVWSAILRALAAAHDSGLLHRDVKPENVLLGPADTIKVADFGLSHQVSTHTFTIAGSHMLGTAAYLSPEQIETGRADVRSDLYAAGLVLYEMLTGTKAVTGDSLVQVAYQHVHGTVPPPSSQVPDLPDELDELCCWATQRDPADRPADAASLLRRATQCAAGLSEAQLDARPTVTRGATSDSPTARLVHPTRQVPRGALSSAAEFTGPTSPATSSDATVPSSVGTSSGAVVPAVVTAASATSSRRRPARWWASLTPGLRGFLVALTIGILLLGAGYWHLFLGPAATRLVPDVRAKSQDEAVTALSAEDLSARLESQYSEDTQRGLVISTDPDSGSETKRGRAVTLVVSLGPERYDIPAVRKLTPEQATDELGQRKLRRAGDREEFSETVAAGLVTRADPTTGTRVKPGTEVTLWISKGRQPIPVPSYVGKPLQDVKNAMAAYELTAVVTKEEFSNTVPKGAVIAQDPSRGTIYRKSQIRFVVSKGPDLIPVPAVSGKSEAEAVALLRQAGFTVEVRRRLGGIFGTAHSTEPGAGSRAGRGSTIVLNVV